MELTESQLKVKLKSSLEERDRAIRENEGLTKSLKDVNRKLSASEEFKSSFLSNLRNEINNPLASIIALSSEMRITDDKKEKCDIDDKHKCKKLTWMILYEALSLDFQVRNMLAASELEAGDSLVHVTSVDVGKLVESSLENFQLIVEENKISIETNIPEGCRLDTDSDKLELIISNLISNALVFSDPPHSVLINAEIAGDEFIFSVKDEGIGIRKEDQEVIFDRFKELDTGTTKRYRGHGLGLSITKALAEVMLGSVSVESSLGEGSTFTLVLPLSEAAAAVDITEDGMEYFVDGEKEF